MKSLMKSMGHLGNVILNNKGKILMGIGAMALAPALRWAMQRYLGMKAELEAEEEEMEKSPSPPKPRVNKREIYQAPKVPPQNLIRH